MSNIYNTGYFVIRESENMPGKVDVFIPVYIEWDREYSAWGNPQINPSAIHGLILSAEEIRTGDAVQIAARLNALIASGQSVYYCRDKKDGFDQWFLQKNWHLSHPGVFILTLSMDVEQLQTLQESVTSYPSAGRPCTIMINRDRFNPKAEKIGPYQLRSLEERVQLLQSDKEVYLPGQIDLKYTVVPRGNYNPSFQFDGRRDPSPSTTATIVHQNI